MSRRFVFALKSRRFAPSKTALLTVTTLSLAAIPALSKEESKSDHQSSTSVQSSPWISVGLGSSVLETLVATHKAFTDVSLSKGHGVSSVLTRTLREKAAIDAQGNLLQFSLPDQPNQHESGGDSRIINALKGAQLKQVATTLDGVYALSASKKSIYFIPKNNETEFDMSGWLWATRPCSQIQLDSGLKSGEKIEQIATGKDFVLARTSLGRVLGMSAPLASESGFMQEILSQNELNVVKSLESLKIVELATGENHALFRTEDGRVFGLGSNRMGQLSSQDKEYQSKILKPIELQTIWSPVQVMAKPMEASCSKIAAGGETSLFAIDRPDGTQVLGCGFGQWGQVGHGGFNHAQHQPVRIKALCDLAEFNEKTNQVQPIRISKLSLGNTHSSAVLDNATGGKGGADSTYGREVFMWGNNAHGQLARADGKKGNSALPLRPRAQKVEVSKSDEGAVLEENDRLRLLPTRQVKLTNGKLVQVSQELALGHGVTLVYDRISE